MKKIVLSLAFVIGLTASASAQVLYTSFSFYGTPQSWVSGGATESLTPAQNYTFSPSINYQNGVSFSIIQSGYTNWWYLDFASATQTPLQVGYYGNAIRFPFNVYDGVYQLTNQNGLSFVGDGRGDNGLTGYFDVLQVDYSPGGSLRDFAADFVQYDEGVQAAANYGSIRYNSTIAPSPVPEPSAYALVLGSFGFLGLLARRMAGGEVGSIGRSI